MPEGVVGVTDGLLASYASLGRCGGVDEKAFLSRPLSAQVRDD
jgi:hypothetical protein